jgi:hypothetical protein
MPWGLTPFIIRLIVPSGISSLKSTLITLIIYLKSSVYILTYFIVSLEYLIKTSSRLNIINLSVRLLAGKDLRSTYP